MPPRHVIALIAITTITGCSSCDPSPAPPADHRPEAQASAHPTSQRAATTLDPSSFQVRWSSQGGALLLWDERAVSRAREAGKPKAACPLTVFDLRRGRVVAHLEATCAADCPACTRRSLTIETAKQDKLLALVDHERLSLWRLDEEAHELIDRPVSPNLVTLSISPDAERLLLADESGAGEILDTDGNRLGAFGVVDEDGNGRAFDVAWDASGRRFVVTGDEAYSRSLPPMSIRDGTTGALLRAVKLDGAGSPRWLDEQRLLVSNENGLLAEVAVATGEARMLRPDEGAPLGPHQAWGTLTRDRRRFAFVAGDARLELWDLATGHRTELLPPAEVDWVSWPNLSPDETHLALARGQEVLLVDPSGNETPQRIPLAPDEPPSSVAATWSASGLLVLQRPGAVITYDARGQERQRIPLPEGARFLPHQDRRLALLWSDQELSLIRLADGARLALRASAPQDRLELTADGSIDAFAAGP